MAGAITVTAHAGEPLDALVFRILGTAAVEPVLEANPGLAELGVFLPEGQTIVLPEIASAPPSAELVQLWD